MKEDNGWEWLRILTPILLTLSLWIVNDIRANLIALEIKFDRFVENSAQYDLQLEARLTKLEAKYGSVVQMPKAYINQ